MNPNQHDLRFARVRLIGLCALMLLAGLAFARVAGPPRWPGAPPRLEDVVRVLSGASLPVAPFAALVVDLVWLLWTWIFGSLCVELLLAAADALARGATWVRSTRAVADRFSAPLARKAVTAAFAVQLVSRGVQPVSAQTLDPGETMLVADAASSAGAVVDASAPAGPTYLVRTGDTLWSIAESVYGSGEAYRRIIDANVGRRMPDGKLFSARGVIEPGWELVVPGADLTSYVVQPGDTLSSVAAARLGDTARWGELFDVNRGTQTTDRLHALNDPDVIWPGLRLRIPSAKVPSAKASSPEPEPVDVVVEQAATETIQIQAASVQQAEASISAEEDRPPLLRTPHAFEPVALEPLDTAPPELEADTSSRPQDGAASNVDSSVPPPPSQAQLPAAPIAAGGIGLVAIAGLAYGGHRIRKRLRPLPQEPETEVVVEGGFAEAQLAQDLTRGLRAAGFDPLAALVGQLQQSLTEYNLGNVGIVCVRHGRSSTTITLRCSLAEQGLLLDLASTFAEGLGANAEAWVTPDQDVALQLTRVRRTRLLPSADRADSGSGLVPLGVLYDRQIFAAGWDTLGHVLIASVPGHGADTILTSLVATLTARRSPQQLRVWMLSAPRLLPPALYELPHIEELVDVSDASRLAPVLEKLRSVLDRRAANPSPADLAVVIPEITSLGEHAEALAALASTALQLGVRFVCASTSLEDAPSNPLWSHLATRMVLRMPDEEKSVALLGVADAAFLGGGGRLLVRQDGREPVELYGYQVSAEHLERLVKLMRSAYQPARDIPGPTITPPTPSAPARNPEEEVDLEDPRPAPEVESVTAPPDDVFPSHVQRAPVEVTCLGAPRVVCAGQQVWPNSSSGDAKPWELLLYLACQPRDGIDRDVAVEALWPEHDDPENAAHRFRQLRYRLRRLLLAVPGAPENEGICLDRGRLRLDPGIVHSDAQEFLELLHEARSTHGTQAIELLQRARALYASDLLEGPDVRRYAWVTDRDGSGVTLREHFRRLLRQATQRLAELYHAGGMLDLALQLYADLSEMDPADDQVWLALFRLHAERGDRLGLMREERRMREVLRELVEDLGPGEGDQITELGRETMQEYRRLLASLRDPEPATA